MSQPPPSRRLDLLTAVWLAYALLVARFWFVCDDAWISFRYARNLANGLGLRFNPADVAPVEGYSNFLWVVAASGIEWLNADVSLWMPLFSAICGAVLVARVFARARNPFGLDDMGAAVVALSIGLFPPFALWATSGLETMPFSLALFVLFDELFLRESGPRPARALVLGLLVAGLRVEGVLWVAAMTCLAALPLGRGGAGTAPRPVLRFALLFAVLFAAYEVWRLWVFGDYLPNTVRAKASMSPELLQRGFDYTAVYFLTFLTPFLLIPASLATLGKLPARLAIPTLALAWAFPTYAVLTAGDFMAMGRFLVPGVPFFSLACAAWLAASLGETASRRRSAFALALFAIVVALLPGFDVHLVPESVRARHHFRHSAPAYRNELEQWRFMRHNARGWQQLGGVAGRYGRSHWGDEASLVATAVGAVGYHSDLTIYDQAGLISRDVTARAQSSSKLRSPGHDRQVGAWFFLDEDPSLLRATWIEADDSETLRREVVKSAKELRRVLPKREAWTRYVPHIEPVAVAPVGYAAALFWRRIPADQPWQEAWQEFDRELAALAVRGAEH